MTAAASSAVPRTKALQPATAASNVVRKGLDSRAILVPIFIIALLIFGLTVVRYLNSPLRFDETEWPVQAVGILHHGVPEVLYQEERLLYADPSRYYGYDAHYGMWHPPLYLYSLAVGAAFFGTGNVPMRLVSLAWLALSMLMAWRITGLLMPAGPKIARALPIALVVLTPLLADGGLYLDIDNTSLAFALLLFTYFFLKAPQDSRLRHLLFLAVLFAFSLGSKLTTPYILLATVVIYHFLNREYRRGIYQALFVGGLGTALFGVAYGIYCLALHYPAGFMFAFTYVGKRGSFISPQSLALVVRSLRWNLVWISPPIVLLLGTLLTLRFGDYLRRRVVEKVDFMVIFSILGLAAYTLWTGTLGKYTFPPVLFGVIAAGCQLGASLIPATYSRRTVSRLAALTVLLALGYLIAIPPLQPRPAGFDFATGGVAQKVLEVRNLYLALVLLTFLPVVIVSLRLLREQQVRAVMMLALLVYLLALNPVNDVKMLASPYDRSPYHPFEESGFTSTVTFLNKSLGSRDVIFSPKDVGFYFHGKYYVTEAVVGLDGGTGVKRVLGLPDVEYVVDSADFPTIPNLQEMLPAGSYSFAGRFGSFIVFRHLVRRTASADSWASIQRRLTYSPRSLS